VKYGLCSVSQKLELIGKKLVLFLESAGQIYPETCLTFEEPKCVLANVINYIIIIKSISTLMYMAWHVDKYKITFKLVINHWANEIL